MTHKSGFTGRPAPEAFSLALPASKPAGLRGGPTPIPPSSAPRTVRDASGAIPSAPGDSEAPAFRSLLVRLEVTLRELMARDVAGGKLSAERTEQVLQCYDQLAAASSSALGVVLKLMRGELSRAIFSDAEESAPYFHRLDALTRENALITAELAALESDVTSEQTKVQLVRLKASNSFMEHEVERLHTENSELREKVERLEAELEQNLEHFRKGHSQLEQHNQNLVHESRDLQHEVYRLKKEARDHVAGTNLYESLRRAKMDHIEGMFHAGHEHAALLLLLHQLEAVVNSAMSPYEQQLLKCAPEERQTYRAKFFDGVGLVLEEYHSVNDRRNALESATRRGLSSTPALHPTRYLEGKGAAAFLADVAAPYHGTAQEQRGMTGPLLADAVLPGGAQEPRAAPDAVHAWADTMFGCHVGQDPDPDPEAWLRHKHFDPAAVFHDDVTAPLLDVTADKFLSGLELHNNSAAGYSCFRTVNWVDPSVAYELPADTTHVKVKFMNPLQRPVARRFGREDTAERTAEAKEGQHLAAWAPPSDRIPPQDLAPDHSGEHQQTQPEAESTKEGSGASATHWRVYRRRYRNYAPFLPRQMPVELIDFIMMHTFRAHGIVLRQHAERLQHIASARTQGAALTRAVTERLLREEYTGDFVQDTLFDVLESFFIFPEIVMKAAYELLTSMEELSRSETGPASHLKEYMLCLGGLTPPPVGELLALGHSTLLQFWPVADADKEAGATEAELKSVLRGMYPSDTLVRVNLEEMVDDIKVHCEGVLTLDRVRAWFTHSVFHTTEPALAKMVELVQFKASVVHWPELDFNTFFDAVRTAYTETHHDALWVQHVHSCCVYSRQNRLPPEDLGFIAAVQLWLDMGKARATVAPRPPL